MDERTRMARYLLSLEPEADPLLRELRQYAAEHYVPIVRPETESLLRTITILHRPRRILEIGTAIGYSTIVLARAQRTSLRMEARADADEDANVPRLITAEQNDRRAELARGNLDRAGLLDQVELCHCDAGLLLDRLLLLEERFDLVFLDAAKGQYLPWLPRIKALLREGGVLIADNVLQDGTVTESRFLVERRDRTTHQRMRDFLYELKHSPEFETSVIPLGDGVSLSVRKSVAQSMTDR